MKNGSSPLARGTLWAFQLGTRERAVHPHSRGEHFGGAMLAGSFPGSSPLARGTRRPLRGDKPSHRFIPTRAGNTSGIPCPFYRSAVHPHSRGEHKPIPFPAQRISGSSPLARGTREDGRRRLAGNRFIPTRAGNTSQEVAVMTTATVHPHSRGEHSLRMEHHRPGIGSSPLARGTHLFPGGGRDCGRFIPTRAGNTA